MPAMTVDRAQAPAAPGRLGEPIPADALITYLDALHEWRGLRKQELDRLDAAALRSSDADTYTADLSLAMAMWQSVTDRLEQLTKTWDSGRADRRAREDMSRLIWSTGAGTVTGGLSLVESCRLSDALTASLRARLAFDPTAADVAARIADTRASLQRSIDLAGNPKAPKPQTLPNLGKLTTRLDGLADQASRGADVTGPLIVLEGEAARAERDLIVTSAAHRTLARDYRAALVQRDQLEKQEEALRRLVEKATSSVAPVPRFAVPDVERLGRVPQQRAELNAYQARLEAVGRALTFAENAYAAPLAELEELRGRLQAYRAKAAATGRADDPAVATSYHQAETALSARPCPLPQARELVAAYQRSLSTTPAPGGPA